MSKIKLIQARLAKGISQEELADMIGMTQSNYSRRENGHTKISEIEWEKIAKKLEVEKNAIYETENEKINEKGFLSLSQIIIPDFIIEHIELITRENHYLKEKLIQYENKKT